MSKRSMSAITQDRNVKKAKHWSLGLLDSMKDPNEIYKETERIVVIKDKYPKARIHYLMLPRDNISSIYHLNKEHVNLLEEFGTLLNAIKEEHNVTLRAGFHAVPSMQKLHMHIISTDMISMCLKTKIHWNSFNTAFFIPYEVLLFYGGTYEKAFLNLCCLYLFTDLLKEINENGCITKIPSDLHKKLMATTLKCNQCNYEPKTMPQLKEHLKTHIQ